MEYDFYDGKHGLTAWGRIKRTQRMFKWLLENGEIERAKETKQRIEEHLNKFYAVYGENDKY